MEKQRQAMVREQIQRRGVEDRRVLEAMRKVPRHLFVPEGERHLAYHDSPLPIGYGQTISQPYIVAYMTEALHLQAQDKVLEIGTGSGYQAAILAQIVGQVYSIEIIEELASQARTTLRSMKFDNIMIRHGDGYQGWPEQAPFDAIIITAAPPQVPQELLNQLKVGGRMVVPIGSFSQELYRFTKTVQGIKRENLLPVRFVPMVKEDKPTR